MMSYEIIKKPIITENSMDQMADRKYTFEVAKDANKIEIKKAVEDIMNSTVEVFAENDLEKAKKIEPLEEAIDYINGEIKKRHIKRLRKGKCTIELGFILSDITTAFERISDHCSNIAVCILQIHENVFDTHEYMEAMKSKDNVAFEKEVKQYQMMYALPSKKSDVEA